MSEYYYRPKGPRRPSVSLGEFETRSMAPSSATPYSSSVLSSSVGGSRCAPYTGDDAIVVEERKPMPPSSSRSHMLPRRRPSGSVTDFRTSDGGSAYGSDTEERTSRHRSRLSKRPSLSNRTPSVSTARPGSTFGRETRYDSDDESVEERASRRHGSQHGTSSVRSGSTVKRASTFGRETRDDSDDEFAAKKRASRSRKASRDPPPSESAFSRRSQSTVKPKSRTALALEYNRSLSGALPETGSVISRNSSAATPEKVANYRGSLLGKSLKPSPNAPSDLRSLYAPSTGHEKDKKVYHEEQHFFSYENEAGERQNMLITKKARRTVEEAAAIASQAALRPSTRALTFGASTAGSRARTSVSGAPTLDARLRRLRLEGHAPPLDNYGGYHDARPLAPSDSISNVSSRRY